MALASIATRHFETEVRDEQILQPDAKPRGPDGEREAGAGACPQDPISRQSGDPRSSPDKADGRPRRRSAGARGGRGRRQSDAHAGPGAVVFRGAAEGATQMRGLRGGGQEEAANEADGDVEGCFRRRPVDGSRCSGDVGATARRHNSRLLRAALRPGFLRCPGACGRSCIEVGARDRRARLRRGTAHRLRRKRIFAVERFWPTTVGTRTGACRSTGGRREFDREARYGRAGRTFACAGAPVSGLTIEFAPAAC